MKKRIESLDWLRGLMAVSIMTYHLLGRNESSTLLGRLGIYGVSVFFVLSGLSMAIVYGRWESGFKSAAAFMIRRIFRIWPLLWVCIFIVVIAGPAHGKLINPYIVFINLTTTFSVFGPGDYINMGAWSIGNEMVYYLFTPLIFWAYNKGRFFGNSACLLLLGAHVTYAFSLLDPTRSLASQWLIYVNPLNNAFLYFSGVSIYYNARGMSCNSILIVCVTIVLCAGFAAYPAGGDQINLVTGWNRVFFSGISILIVLMAYVFSAYEKVPRIVGVPLEKFGLATYGVYLLHPIAFEYLLPLLHKAGLSKALIGMGLFAATFAAALVSFNYFELKFVKIGKALSERL